MTCVDKNCGDCTGDSTKCLGDGIKSSCYDGYYRQDDGKLLFEGVSGRAVQDTDNHQCGHTSIWASRQH